MKIFLDVGGHFGETVEAVLDPVYGFHRIWTFEPASPCWPHIEAYRDPRITLVKAGLADRDFRAELFAPGTLAGSIYDDGDADTSVQEECAFISASSFFREHITESDSVYVKFNCEGAEIAIIESLLDSGEWRKITSAMIDFDAQKVKSLSGRVGDIQSRLKACGKRNYYSPEDLMYNTGSHFAGIRNWLNRTGARERSLSLWIQSICYHICNILLGRQSGFYKFKVVKRLPKAIVNFYYAKIKHQ